MGALWCGGQADDDESTSPCGLALTHKSTKLVVRTCLETLASSPHAASPTNERTHEGKGESEAEIEGEGEGGRSAPYRYVDAKRRVCCASVGLLS